MKARSQYTTRTFTQPLLGWRWWAAWKHGLTAAGGYEYWWPGQNVAHCACEPNHLAPEPHCQCGFYAVPAAYLYHVADFGHVRLVPGIAFLWGRIVRHQTGVRAEYAQVACLIGGEREARLAHMYKVPLFSSIDESIAWAKTQDASILDGYPWTKPVVGFVFAVGKDLSFAGRPVSLKPATSGFVVFVQPPVLLRLSEDTLHGSAVEPVAVYGLEANVLAARTGLPELPMDCFWRHVHELAARHGAMVVSPRW